MSEVTQVIAKGLGKALEQLGLLDDPVPDFDIEHPKDEAHGDYSTNIALAIFGGKQNSVKSKLYKSPRDLAEKLITSLQSDIEVNNLIHKMEVAGPGFINFWIKEEWLLREVEKATKSDYGMNELLKNKKVMVEYTDPNPFKEFHIGHLMSNTIGESIARLMESRGALVKRANYQGDVGLHVAKSVWGMKEKIKSEGLTLSEVEGWNLQDRQKFLGQCYALGAGKYEENEKAKEEMHVLNKAIYDESHPEINKLYKEGREWSLEYFETIYSRLGTKFDEYFFESEAGKVGLQVVEEGLEKGVLEIGENGAVVYKGEKDGLHTRVFRNKLGLATYEGKELGLAKTKYERYPYDLSYIVTANEIDEYFKVLLKVMSHLFPDLAAKTTHLSHGVMKLKTGKMSSRTGKVVTGEGLLNELKEVVLAKMGSRNIENKEQVADQIAVGALKYTVLKQQIGGDIVYDPEKMTNMEGDTGPYVQYTYARTCSVLDKFAPSANKQMNTNTELGMNAEEMAIVRWIYRYGEVVETAGRTYSPHMVASYVYELASRYNAFYNKHKIVGGENENLRIVLTQAVGQTIKSGLNLLGIAAPQSM